MRLQDRDYEVLKGLATYGLLNRHLLQLLYFPQDREGRVTRRRLEAMVKADYVRKPREQPLCPRHGFPCPVFYLGVNGRDALAERFDDPAYLAKPVSIGSRPHLDHMLAVSEFHLALRDATDAHPDVSLVRWVNENEPINLSAPEDQQRRLFSELLVRPRLVCNPDAGFVLQKGEHKVVYYLERERGGTGAKQLYDRKTRGFDVLKQKKHHCDHFPEATHKEDFIVVCVAQSQSHLRRLVNVFRGREAAALWRFANAKKIDALSILTEPLWHHADRDSPAPLIK